MDSEEFDELWIQYFCQPGIAIDIDTATVYVDYGRALFEVCAISDAWAWTVLTVLGLFVDETSTVCTLTGNRVQLS